MRTLKTQDIVGKKVTEYTNQLLSQMSTEEKNEYLTAMYNSTLQEPEVIQMREDYKTLDYEDLMKQKNEVENISIRLESNSETEFDEYFIWTLRQEIKFLEDLMDKRDMIQDITNRSQRKLERELEITA